MESGLGLLPKNGLETLKIMASGNVVNAITPAESKDHLWLGTNKGFSYYNKKTNRVEFSIDAKDGLLGNEVTTDGLLYDDEGMLWIGTYHGVTVFNIKKRKPVKHTPMTYLERILLNGKESKILDQFSNYYKRIILKSHENNLVFEINGMSFKDEKSIEYEYHLRGLENNYSVSTGKEYKAYYQNLPPGKYDFFYRSKGKDDIWSSDGSFRFEILKPYWKTWWFILLCISSFFLVAFAYTKLRMRALKIRNADLEKTVKDRTKKMVETNRQLLQSNTNLSELTSQLVDFNDQLNLKNQQIMASIRYASTIQLSILPKEDLLKRHFSEHFVIWKPRDIVGGDFYWFDDIGHGFLVAVVDCTGHGIPGAFMTMTANSVLNRIVEESHLVDPAEILKELNRIVRMTLNQDSDSKALSDDGLDIGLCYCSPQERRLVFSGARFRLYCSRPDGTVEIKGNRQSIGYQKSKEDYTYTNHEMVLEDDSVFYLVTDGFIDQSGGQKGYSFGKKRLKRIFQENHSLPLIDQKKAIEDCHIDYQAHFDQRDDITLLGFKISKPQ